MNKISEVIDHLLTAIILIALVALIVSKGTRVITALQSGFSTFDSLLGVVVSPVKPAASQGSSEPANQSGQVNFSDILNMLNQPGAGQSSVDAAQFVSG